MKIKQLKEKTAQGLKDFLPKIGVNDIEGLLDTLNDKLSKSQGGEIKKPIVITNNNSNYSITINPDGNVFIYNKDYSSNIFNIRPYNENATDVIIDGNRHNASLYIDDIVKLISKRGEIYNSNDIFTASKFKLRGGTNNQVLLGDGSTTSKLVSYISTSPQFDAYIVNILNIDGAHDSFTIFGATKELAGLMTATDKAKLDNVPNKYAEKSKTIDNQNGNIYSQYNVNNGDTILDISGNYSEESSGGKIRLRSTEEGKGKVSIVLDGSDGSICAERFMAISNQNGNEVWCTNGTRLNVLNLLSNAAIYVAGSFALAERGYDDVTVIDEPDSIIFDQSRKKFLARKSLICYSHWNADISKNIAPPSRYGIETNTGVFPFNSQMYRFAINNYIYIATCSNGTCSMNELTINKE